MTSEKSIQLRWVELLVAACFVAVSVLVITDSLRIGKAWGSDGPEPGYFPFYIGCLMLLGAVWVMLQTLMGWRKDGGQQVFSTTGEFSHMLMMLVPTGLFVAATVFLGIYLAALLLIAAFMVWQGRYSVLRSVSVALGVSVSLYLLFEIWFLMPLPKGLLENGLGA